MATARKNVSKTPRTAAGKPARKETAEKAGKNERDEIEENFRVELGNGKFIDFQITIASAPKVGPGPRPRFDEMVLVRRIDTDRVLTLNVELGRQPTAGIKIGSGGPPTTGGH